MLGWMVIGVVVVVFASAAIKTIPAYIEFNTIKGAVNSVLQDSKVGLKSENEIRSDIDKRFVINNVKAISAQNLGVLIEGGRVTVTVDYEVRENLFGNLDLAMTFSEDFRKDGRQ
ncbi:MAG: DUF4845 domain-containing protein [Alcanivoracaceae bacterium]